MITQKIKHGWGYNVGPFPPDVVIRNGTIVHWPTDNPPTIAEIEAVELPEPTPQPDWRAFRSALFASDAYVRIVSTDVVRMTGLNLAVERQHTLSGNDALLNMLEVATLWNTISITAEPTEAEIIALNAIASSANVPFVLNESGLLG